MLCAKSCLIFHAQFCLLETNQDRHKHKYMGTIPPFVVSDHILSMHETLMGSVSNSDEGVLLLHSDHYHHHHHHHHLFYSGRIND